jgi:hypothetical protein
MVGIGAAGPFVSLNQIAARSGDLQVENEPLTNCNSDERTIVPIPPSIWNGGIDGNNEQG